MPGAEYYRKQAQICASLALASRDPSVVAHYNTMALEHLRESCRSGQWRWRDVGSLVFDATDGSDIGRD